MKWVNVMDVFDLVILASMGVLVVFLPASRSSSGRPHGRRMGAQASGLTRT